MKNHSLLIKNLLITCLITCSFLVQAEQKTSQGKYELHYNTFPSTFLSKEIANTYQIIRSKNRGIVSLSILDSSQEKPTAMEAEIQITAKNILNQNKDVKLIKITEKENNAIYYLGTFALNNQEDINFTIKATPANSDEVINLKFSREFFTD